MCSSDLTLFQPGQSAPRLFSVSFNQANLVWTLDGTTITAVKGSSKCASDTQITFEPVDPTQLSQLYPEQVGNKNQPIPETEQAIISLNNNAPTPVVTGQAIIKLAQPI